MSSAYHTPVDYWLAQPIGELFRWVSVAKELSEERENH
jgi:hypothetical protein